MYINLVNSIQLCNILILAGNFIGRGGCSKVYRGFLPDGQSVAVKILNSSSKTEQELLSEVEILTLLKHNHVITLIGYCAEGLNRLLVYNFVSRGNLEENLHGIYSIVLHFKNHEIV